jgi:hypothetical protein
LFAASSTNRQSRFDATGAAMTRDEQIKGALALLDPPPHERKDWRHQIERTLDSIDWGCRTAAGLKAPSSKKGKAALGRYVKALRELQKAYDALPPSLRPWFSLVETAYVAGTPTVIDRELATAQPLLAKKSAPPKRDAILGKLAAEWAYRLLLLRRRKASLTRGGEWERLGKIFSNGTPVFEHMRAFRRSQLNIAG